MSPNLRPSSAGRDIFLDVIRTGSVLAVIGHHWLMPVLRYTNGNALSTPGWWAVTWLSRSCRWCSSLVARPT